MALTEPKAERALGQVGRAPQTHEAAAKQLGVTRARVTQLVSAGELSDLSQQGIEDYKNARQRRQAEREAYKHAQREKQSAERQELLEAIRLVDRHLMMLAAAIGAKGISDTILR